ncbi:MAG: peptidoglycan -binding protein [Alphaproteobacteria bacterium]|nr:peptidoglycan -binding protein [Alphaproteobacteria bacterium]
MAISRRGGQLRFSTGIWPGFVDAMTALLLVLMFVLTIFMIVQFMLRETVTNQDTQLNYLSQQVSSLAKALGIEQQKSDGLETEVTRLDGELNKATSTTEVQAALISTLSQQAKNQQTKIQSFESQVASLLAERAQLVLDKKGLQGDIADATKNNAALTAQISEAEAKNLRAISQKEALQLALATARDEIDQSAEAARLAAAKRQALEALIAQTKADLTTKSTSLQAALAALDDTRTSLGAKTSSLTDVEAQLTKMAADLAASKATHQGDVASLAALQARLNVLESGLSDTKKAQLAVEAAAEQLRAQLAAVQTKLTDKEKARLAEAAAAEALRKRLADTKGALTLEEKSRLAEAAAAELLREKLKNSKAELTAMTLALEQKRQQAEDTLTILAAARVAKTRVDDLLAAALLARDNAKASGKKSDAKIAALAVEKTNLNDRLAAVIAQLKNTDQQNGTLLAAADAKRADLESQLAAALAARLAAEQDASVLMSKSEQRRVLLAEANSLLKDEKAKSAESLRQVEVLSQQTAQLQKRLNSLQGLLDDAKSRDVEAQVQISSLGSNLNTALAQVAAKQKKLADEQKKRADLEAAERKRLQAETKTLKKFKSEFFGQLRDLLGNQKGVRIVGDRFVFSSEVLFAAGSADLSSAGQHEIAKVAKVILDIADKIPADINWVLRVDGHTDNIPLSGTGKYRDNWELSQARALSVVRYMVNSLGMPPNRLAAAGFGEYQPINTANTDAARAQNRRIEMKFTEK